MTASTEQPELPAPQAPQAPVLLPDCAKHHHLAPNICLRSPLFGVFERRGCKNGTIVKDLPIAAVNGDKIFFTGQRLHQGDFEVFVQLVRMTAGRQDQTGFLQFSVREILRGLGRSYGNLARQAILDSISRLQAGQLTIIIHREGKRAFTYKGSFVDKFGFSHEKQTYLLRLNHDLKDLFSLGWSKLDWQQRLALTSDLAKWLHGFFASNLPVCLPIKVSKLRDLCGSQISRVRDFRSKLKVALTELQRIGTIKSWVIDTQERLSVELHALQDEADMSADRSPAAAPSMPEVPSPEPAEQSPPREPLILIPLIKKDGDFPVYQEDLDQWQETFPGVDVLLSLRRIRQWNLDNPSRRKTLAGIRRHVSIWLGRDQDAAAGTQSTDLPPPDQAKKVADHQAESEVRRTREYMNSLYN